jgi:REP element-mobilizing transposase RayT
MHRNDLPGFGNLAGLYSKTKQLKNYTLMKSKLVLLEQSKFYHIYNRGNNRELLFYKSENYEFFLKKYDEYLSDFIETYVFCLLPNHFHFLIRVKDDKPVKNNSDLKISKQFSNLFNCYSKAINNQQQRAGSLFQKPFKRIEVTNTNYLTNLVFYIHANPELHGIIEDFRGYTWSSYARILTSKPSKLEKDKVIEWFDDKTNYIYFHTQKIDMIKLNELMIE